MAKCSATFQEKKKIYAEKEKARSPIEVRNESNDLALLPSRSILVMLVGLGLGALQSKCPLKLFTKKRWKK